MAAAEHLPRVLFLCTGNSCRSQMAEGFARAMHSSRIEAHSAGTKPHGLNPLAVRAMHEAGVDISGHASKTPDAIGIAFDLVVTVCGHADEHCPHFPGARVVHVGFDDPPRLAAGAASDDEAMPHYRRVRDEIRAFVATVERLLPDACRHEGHQP
jgi:arsenate reductase